MDPQVKSSDPGEEALLEEALEAPAGLGYDGPVPSIDELLAAEDVEGLMELGAVYRAGAPHAERDLFKALECFEAASRLGHADAEYLVGVAHFNGLGVQKDQAEGAKRLRSAAQRGSLRAKVYVANLYEMGVHYAADREKADVWYRNVARAAGVEAEPDTDAYDVELAELGCVRHCLKLVADEALPKKDRAFYLKKAKAMGYAHRLREARRTADAELAAATATGPDAGAAPAEPTDPEPGSGAQTDAPAPGGAATEAAADGGGKREAVAKGSAGASGEAAPEDEEVLLGAQWTWGAGLASFFAASFFAASAAVAAFLSTEGSRALAEAGRPLPLIDGHHEAVLAAVLVALGVLPATATYRPKVVAVAAAFGVAGAAGAFYLFDTQPLLWDRAAQAGAGGLAVFLSFLLALGVLGGTRWRPRKPSAGGRAKPSSDRRGA